MKNNFHLVNNFDFFGGKINSEFFARMRSDEALSCYSVASPWPALDLDWSRKFYPTTAPRSSNGLMFGLPPGGGGTMGSLKEEPLGARAASWMQPIDTTK